MPASGSGFALTGLLFPRAYRGDSRLVPNDANQASPQVVDDLLFVAAGSGSQALTAARFDNAGDVYAAELTPGPVAVVPELFGNQAAFYAAVVGVSGGVQSLTAERLDNAATFYAATVGRGAVSLAPGRFDSAAAFYAASVSQAGGAQSLTAARFDSAGSFYVATVARGSVALAPSRLDNAPTFYAPAVGRPALALTPGRLDNLPAFYAAVCVRSEPTALPADRFDYLAAAGLPSASPHLARMAAHIQLVRSARQAARRRR